MQIKIFDTTLRDGEQTPGVSLIPDEKLRIASKLDILGVDVIEAGFAITSPGEEESIKKITSEGLSAEICSFSRPIIRDIDAALSCDVDSINLVVPTSDLHLQYKLHKSRDDILNQSINAIEYAKSHGLIVELSAEDSTRSDMNFLEYFFREGIDNGVDRICACDTVGILTPDNAYEFYGRLSKLNVPLSVHCHNDFGLATANSLMGLKAGASQVHGTINGIGERAGNASLEEVIVALYSLYKYKLNIKMSLIYETSRLVSRLTNIQIPPNKSLVGENAFAHESGIHADGMIKNSETYEPITPELIGHHRRFVLGKHIGTHMLHKHIINMGINVTDDQLQVIFNRIKSLADKGKCITDVEVHAITEDVVGFVSDKVVDLKDVTIVSGNKVTPTASVKMEINGDEVVGAGIGLGPVDAAIIAIRKSIEDVANIELVEYHVDAITGGTDALIDVIVKVKYGDDIVTARSTEPDIIMASVEAYVAAVNRLLSNFNRGLL